MTKLVISSVAGALALVIATPASAQLLGGATGQLGGGLGGTLGQLGGAVNGTLRGAGRIDASPRVDPDQGRASAGVDGSTSADGAVDGTLDAAGRSVDLGANGSASANGGASAGVDTIGTDAVRSTVGNVADTGRRAVNGARNAAAGAVDTARSTAGNAVNSASGSASAAANAAGSAQGSLGGLALAGSAAANGDGAFAVSPGMNVTDTNGKVIGTVRNVATTGKGAVRSVTVAAGDTLATLPAANFSGSGNVLASAMTRGEIEEAADQQADTGR